MRNKLVNVRFIFNGRKGPWLKVSDAELALYRWCFTSRGLTFTEELGR